MKFRSKVNRSTVVEFVADAEMRVGEMRTTVVIYRRGERHYVRKRAEFLAKFEPLTAELTS